MVSPFVSSPSTLLSHRHFLLWVHLYHAQFCVWIPPHMLCSALFPSPSQLLLLLFLVVALSKVPVAVFCSSSSSSAIIDCWMEIADLFPPSRSHHHAKWSLLSLGCSRRPSCEDRRFATTGFLPVPWELCCERGTWAMFAAPGLTCRFPKPHHLLQGRSLWELHRAHPHGLPSSGDRKMASRSTTATQNVTAKCLPPDTANSCAFPSPIGSYTQNPSPTFSIPDSTQPEISQKNLHNKCFNFTKTWSGFKAPQKWPWEYLQEKKTKNYRTPKTLITFFKP